MNRNGTVDSPVIDCRRQLALTLPSDTGCVGVPSSIDHLAETARAQNFALALSIDERLHVFGAHIPRGPVLSKREQICILPSAK
jgi:hypothetical protein